MWQFFLGFAIALLVTFVLRPRPQNAKPAGLDEIQAPTAEEGREIPVLFGCRELKGANVVWYGDLKTNAIRVSGGKK